MNVRTVSLLGLLLTASLCRAVVLDPPTLHCASVNIAGDVTLTWTVPADPGGDFAHYEVFWSATLAGPYNLLLPTIPVYGQTTVFHAGAGANSGPVYYYMTTVSSGLAPNTSIPSDTLATIFLTVNQSTPLGSAVLDWTPQHTPPIATASANYSVWMEYPIGTWSLVGTVANTVLHYEHVISVCDDSLTFRISLSDNLGCTSFSSLDGAQFHDDTPPSSPVMVTVSVDTASGLATLDWLPSPENDTQAYIIVYSGPGGNVILDTIYGQNNTFYTWLNSQAGFNPEGFTVAAFDTCYSGNPSSPNTSATLAPHTTIHASTTYDKCNGVITLNWTPYVGWPVQNYLVYAKATGGAQFLLGTYSGTTLTAVHDGVTPFTQYCYVVKALRDGGGASSLSNKTCRTTDYPPVPAFNYVRRATVASENDVLVEIDADMSAAVRRYLLERSTNGEPWYTIAIINGLAGPLIQFDDVDADTGERSYQYRVQVEDSCGNTVLQSNIGTSIFLQAEPDLEGFNHLKWNGYEDWAGSVSGYTIYRSVAGGPFSAYASTGSAVWEYTDDVRSLMGTNGRFCYLVEANETGNPNGFDATSMSNEACAVQQEEVYIPNAFIEGGINHIFIPVTAYTEKNNYEFTIFNRWGQEIWTTTDPDQGWDGTVNDDLVPLGVYGYYCAFRNGEGRDIVKRGFVTFVRSMKEN